MGRTQEQGLGLVLWSFELPPQRLGISWAGSGVSSMSLPDLSHPYSLFFLSFQHLFILAALGPSCHTGSSILVAACRLFSCGMWDPAPRPGIVPRPPCIGSSES